MRLVNTTERFGLISHLLHWSIAALMLFLIVLGWYMVGLDYYTSPYYELSYRLHESLGLLVFAIGIAGIAWRFLQRHRPEHFRLRPWERRTARTVHVLLGLMVISLPISGYLFAGGDRPGVGFFGLFHLPLLPAAAERWREACIEFHYYAAYGGSALIALHAAGAARHWFFDMYSGRSAS